MEQKQCHLSVNKNLCLFFQWFIMYHCHTQHVSTAFIHYKVTFPDCFSFYQTILYQKNTRLQCSLKVASAVQAFIAQGFRNLLSSLIQLSSLHLSSLFKASRKFAVIIAPYSVNDTYYEAIFTFCVSELLLQVIHISTNINWVINHSYKSSFLLRKKKPHLSCSLTKCFFLKSASPFLLDSFIQLCLSIETLEYAHLARYY